MTHCFELYRQIISRCEDIKSISSNYTANGLEAVIKDKFDDQIYTLTIKPRKD